VRSRVSVSNFQVSVPVSAFMTKSRPRLEIWARSRFRSRKLRSRLHHCTSVCGITAECGVDKSVNTSAAHVCAFTRLSPYAKTQSVTLTNFFVTQTVTTSVATAVDFSLDLGFSCFIWGSWIFNENLRFVWFWSNFRNVCCITVFTIQEYSSFV